jgi:nucleotide-binding universal stress UspA family protein
MFEKILVCLDGSKLAEQILPLVEAQAKQFNSKVILLQVVYSPSPQVIQAGATYNDPKILSEQEQVNVENAKSYLESVRLLLQSKGITGESVVLRNYSIGRSIMDFAEKNSIGLIAIATHGHGGLGRLVFGSVAEQVLRESGLPMLLIRPQK